MRIKNDYLSSQTSYQMLLKLIHKYNYSLDELASKLDLNPSELEDLLTKKAVRKKLAAKLTIPLTNLYCQSETSL